MCWNSESLIVSPPIALATSCERRGRACGGEPPLPSSPPGGLLPPTALAEVSCIIRVPTEWGTLLLCWKAPCPPQKIPWDPLTSSLGAWGCPVGLLGSAQAQGQASPGSPKPDTSTLGNVGCWSRGVGDPIPGPPSFGASCWPWSRVCRQEASGRARNSADWLLCYYPETGAEAERAGGWWGAPASVFTPVGGRTPAPRNPPGTAGPLRFHAGVYCSAPGCNAGAPGRAVCSLPLDESWFLRWFIFLLCG